MNQAAQRQEADVRARARDWAQRFEPLLRGPWTQDAALALHEELDRIANAADAAGDEPLAIAAVELTVYLCYFVEDGNTPDAAQMEAMRRMARGLAGERVEPAAADDAPVTLTAPVTLAAPVAGATLMCLTDDPALVAELSIELAQHDIGLVAHASAESVLAASPFGGMHGVLVDASHLGALDTLARQGARLAAEAQRPLLIALLREAQVAQRMQALRAGADHVLAADAGLAALAARIARLLGSWKRDPLRVMVIDDDRSQAVFCESVLRHAGVVARLHSDPREALADIGAFAPEVVLLDLYMPEIDGLEMAARIREQPGTEFTSIVFISGDHEADTRFQALAAGGDDFLTKPVLPRHLIAAVVNRGRRARQLRARFEPAG